MFLHGGWFHIISNMWFLWIFGNNVRRLHGAPALRDLLSTLWPIGCGLANRVKPGFSDTHGRCLRRDRRHHGQPKFCSTHVRMFTCSFSLAFSLQRLQCLGYLMLGYWFLLQIVGGFGNAQCTGWGRILGSHRRFPRRSRADPGIPRSASVAQASLLRMAPASFTNAKLAQNQVIEAPDRSLDRGKSRTDLNCDVRYAPGSGR